VKCRPHLVRRLVHRPREDDAHLAAASIPELRALLEAHDLVGRITRRITKLDALLFDDLRGEVAATLGLAPNAFRVARWRSVTALRFGLRSVVAERRGGSVELRLGLRKLELELGHVDALGLRHEEAPRQQRHLLEQPIIGLLQLGLLGDQRRDLGLARPQRCLERGDALARFARRPRVRRRHSTNR